MPSRFKPRRKRVQCGLTGTSRPSTLNNAFSRRLQDQGGHRRRLYGLRTGLDLRGIDARPQRSSKAARLPFSRTKRACDSPS